MAQAAVDRDYTDFEPASEWVQEEERDTLIVKLPGFGRNEVKVQVTSAPLLRIFGERQISLNTYTRFKKEFPISASSDINRIAAKFEAGQLHVVIPKVGPQVTPEVPPKPREEKEEAKGDKVNSQKAASQKEKEQPSDQAAAEDAQKKVRTDGPVETDAGGGAKIVERLKTHLLDLSKTIRLTGVDDYSAGGAEDYQDKKKLAAPSGRQSNKKKLLNLFVAILMFVVLCLYVKNAFKSSSLGSKFQEL